MKKIVSTLALSLSLLSTQAQEQTYAPTAENLAEREAFQDAKFGIFLHWGLYAMLATGEWTMTNNNINYQEYQKLAGGFYPNSFDANEWAKAIKDAGAGYICFTSRHHEGFSMWNTQQSNYNIVKATPFGRDVVGELAKACADNDLRFHLYYSLVDWWREDAPRGRTGLGTGRVAEKEDYPAYFQFMKNQLTELLTNYGKIGCIWFDGYWDQDQNPSFEWNMKGLYDHIHSIQPACLVANNHHISPLEGEDFQLFERDLPGENNAGLSGQEISRLPLETCETMNGMWGYKITDQRYKSGKTLIHYLVGAAGRGANLLMNIGPQPDGRLPQTALERLKEMGQWLRKYGESIYGTRAGEVSPRPWGVTTRKGNKLYVHVLSLEDDALFVPVTAKVKSSICLNTNEKVKVTNVPGGIVISGLKQIPEEWDRIIVLDAETL